MRWADTAAQAAANNVILAKGELGYTADDHVLKIGDGVTHWNSLAASGGGVSSEQVQDIVGAFVSGTGVITATYNDGANTLVISTTATANSSDATLLARANHTGTQAATTVTGKPICVPFSISGALVVAAGTAAIPNCTGTTINVKKIAFTLKTVNTGAAVTLDANIGGTTMYTTQGNRPSKATGGTSSTVSSSGVPDTAAAAWADGAVITIDVDVVGSTIAGSDLTGMIYGEI